MMDTSRLPVREEHLYPEMENPEKLLNLHKLVNNELPNRDFEHLWNEAFSFYSSFCIVDAIVVPENYIIPTCRSSELILEFKQYKNIQGQRKHIELTRLIPIQTHKSTSMFILTVSNYMPLMLMEHLTMGANTNYQRRIRHS